MGIPKKFLSCVVVLLVSLALAELALRLMLSSETSLGRILRKPGIYADWFSDDNYWKLHNAWVRTYPPPKEPHALLGWVGNFDSGTFFHHDSASIRGRRPILLFGDSFAECGSGDRCIERILGKEDPEFSSSFFLLNYAVGGYGLDQIFILLQKAVPLYEDPIVVFSFMTYDIDRSVLSFRVGQKPYFELIEDELVLKGVPVDSDPERYLAAHPPRIRSFVLSALYRLAHKVKGFGFDDDFAWRPEKIRLGERILLSAYQFLQQRQVPFIYLVFHPGHTLGKDDWRDVWLLAFLRANRIPYLWSKEILRKHPHDLLISEEDHHPTRLYKKLIAEKIARFALPSRGGNARRSGVVLLSDTTRFSKRRIDARRIH